MSPFRIFLVIVALIVVILLSPLPRIDADDTSKEAPKGFDNGTNGLVTQDVHNEDRGFFEDIEDETVGLGPIFNGASCAECHAFPVTGGFSTITELRAGHLDGTGTFIPATAFVNFGADPIPRRSLINEKFTCPKAQETLTAEDNIQARRISLSLLGDGYVEAISDTTLQNIRLSQPEEMRGELVEFTSDTGKTFPSGGFGFVIGRFGWKDQHVSLVDFSADAYLNEMGITNRLQGEDFTHRCEPNVEGTVDPEDDHDIDRFTRFIRATKVPPRGSSADTPEAINGAVLFKSIGCETCHVSEITTSDGTDVPVGAEPIPAALRSKTIHPYSDFLLHRIGTGDGIVQEPGRPNTRLKVRTAPLWGVRKRPLLLHDGSESTLEGAIQRHQGEAAGVIDKYNNYLTTTEQQDIIAFLKSL
jgi:CxxC motif-containing protein (DUF1111 family)